MGTDSKPVFLVKYIEGKCVWGVNGSILVGIQGLKVCVIKETEECQEASTDVSTVTPILERPLAGTVIFFL